MDARILNFFADGQATVRPSSSSPRKTKHQTAIEYARRATNAQSLLQVLEDLDQPFNAILFDVYPNNLPIHNPAPNINTCTPMPYLWVFQRKEELIQGLIQSGHIEAADPELTSALRYAYLYKQAARAENQATLPPLEAEHLRRFETEPFHDLRGYAHTCSLNAPDAIFPAHQQGYQNIKEILSAPARSAHTNTSNILPFDQNNSR